MGSLTIKHRLPPTSQHMASNQFEHCEFESGRILRAPQPSSQITTSTYIVCSELQGSRYL